MKGIKTLYRTISNESPCYIISEIGSNHNGSFDLACELIEKAAGAGVDAVKFQTFKAKNHYSKNTPKMGMYKEDIYSLIEKLEIDRSWHARLSEICKRQQVDFLDSPCDSEAIQIAVGVDMPIIKVASFDMVDVRLIDEISKTGKAVMFSAGMCKLSEIENAVNICRGNGNDNLIVLQCTSVYPAPPHLSNLNAMDTIRKAFNVITGYSDHTMGDHIACAAVALGAKVIEKHYTLSRKMEGPDHAFAIEPHELADMVRKIRDIESGLGDGMKNGPRDEEMEFYKNARRSILSARSISKGEIIQDQDIVIKRPGYGIQPSMINMIIGRAATRDIEADNPITWDMI
ncbi:MAG: N-acetylneuraminate synthase family protein [Daejeonella sp.]|uniref:N-acetylneuraminate synthase family protein n=1 Tax=Daejeonella sp. TaxID=2805397 RepID=UPI002736F94C|nr:N-acetylneuraminate synthase family protein [Daejeonella sp.]MDP3467531.1 N-acetylneuraminate synthase family protein [Daejeonella sp.]